jgi:hypothetical protein
MRKQHLEAYIALLVEFLGLHPDQKERRTDTGLFLPRTGARLLMTTEGCPVKSRTLTFQNFLAPRNHAFYAIFLPTF